MKNKQNDLINKAIIASIEFDVIMDSIDFNSYLLKEDEEVTKTKGYDEYKRKLEKATGCCDNIINENIDEKIKNTKPPYVFSDKDEYELTQYLIWQLFEAKKIRRDGRKQPKREDEKKNYCDATNTLLRAFNIIPIHNFCNPQKDNKLIDNCNWAKVLYYNELAICCSGLAKSSMSLGYAEESISLLEELFPVIKNLENQTEEENLANDSDNFNKLMIILIADSLSPLHIINLYTIALFNKGEAERLLKEENSALRIFRRIVNIYKKCKDKKININPSDYFYALLRETLILIDQGRGQEAIDCLKSEMLDKLNPLDDYRAQVRDLEKASALIDQKEYENAWKLLEVYTGGDFDYTFLQRQAKIYQLRLMNEFQKNRPEDFQVTHKLMKFSDWQKLDDFAGIHYNEKTKNITITLILELVDKDKIVDAMKDEEDKSVIVTLWKKLHPDNELSEMKEIKKGYSIFENSAKDLIGKSSKRKDGDSFKGACTKLAEFYQLENAEKQKKDFGKALKCFHLYLLESKMFSNAPNDINNIARTWLENNDLDNLLQACKDFNPSEELTNNDDENYLRAFFDVYIDSFIKNENKIKPSPSQKETIKKLKERLCDIYQQKDNDIALEQIAMNFEHFIEIDDQDPNGNKDSSKSFIENAFFKNTQGCMQVENIVYQMKRNTEEFIKNVISRSKNHTQSNGDIQGILSVLRRWNSFTPTLSSSINHSKGGGYFFRFSYKDESFGIVIDPGYDFLDNFFSQGFKIGDINLVIVSHAHPDHTDNLAPILSLIYEMNGKLGKYYNKQKINKINPTLILSSGVFEHYNRIIKPSEEVLKDIIVFGGKCVESKSFFEDKIEIKAFRTIHQDLSQFQSLGFIITVQKNEKHKAVIGYTGDIKWRPNKTKQPEYLEYFKECDIICVHIGSIINILKKKDFCNTFCQEYKKSDYYDRCYKYDKCLKSGFNDVSVTKKKLIEQTREENHLYLAGLTMFFDEILQVDLNLKMAIISEFGEELKNGIRMDLHKKFDNWFEMHENKPRCLPGDIGLEVDVFTGNVYCYCCMRYVDRSEIEPVPYGKEEAICFVCKECKAVLSPYQIGHLLKEYCENGRKLESMRLNTNGGLL